MDSDHRARCAALTLLLSVAACAAEPRFDPVLAKSPPEVASATVELRDKPDATGNAILRVRFAAETSRPIMTVDGGFGPTPLRDDGIAPDDRAGDGLYAGIIQIDVDRFLRERERRFGLGPQVREVPVFGRRELLGFEPFRPFKPDDLRPGRESLLYKFRGVPITVDASRELLVTDPAVVEDPMRTFDRCTGAGTPMGAWSFGKLMTEIANPPVTGIDASDFVENWLNQWANDLTINTFTVTKRDVGVQRLLSNWLRLPNGKLDLTQAPFRLLAIVNRLDLRSSTFYGGGDAGEARLVFGALNCPPVAGIAPSPVLQFTVIFEYGVPKSGCTAVRDWAQQWHSLGALAIGSPAYNAALQAITDQFTLRDAVPTRLPNRSAINQVRTNEFALATVPIEDFWQLRESRLVPGGPGAGQLQHMTIAQTPDAGTWQHQSRLRDFVNTHQAAILADHHLVPLAVPFGDPMRGGAVDPGAGFAWDATGITSLDARHHFARATCNGCHTVETRTDFVHIAPRAAGVASQLSDFLTGLNMPKVDPVSGVAHNFHELLDRQMKLDFTANMNCTFDDIFLPPLAPAFVH